jgi:hypothetical protein
MHVNEVVVVVVVVVEVVDVGAAIFALTLGSAPVRPSVVVVAAAAALLHSCLKPFLAPSRHSDDALPRAAPAPYLDALLPYLEAP